MDTDSDRMPGETDTFLHPQGPVNEVSNEADGKESQIGGEASHNFEDVVSAMGPPGRYQIIQCMLLGANILPVVFVNMNFVFIALEPPLSCSTLNENQTSLVREYPHTNTNVTSYHITHVSRCQIGIRPTSNLSGSDDDVTTIDCPHGYRYKGGKHVSITTEWDLVCDQRGTAEMAQTFMSLGWFVGVFFASTFSDKFGRKKTVGLSAALSSICELGCAFAPSIYVMVGLRFFSGLFGSGLSSVTFVLGEEMLVSRHRETFGVYLGLLWSFCSMLLCGIAYAFQNHDWRDLQLCFALCGMAPLVFLYFLDESPSWLYSRGDHNKATQIIQKACRLNAVDFNTIKPTWDNLCAGEIERESHEKAAKDYNVSDLFTNKILRTSVLIAWFAFFTNDFSYFGMYLSASTLAGNLYLNTAIMAVSEIPGCFWVLAMLRRKGRRWVIIFFMIIGLACLIISTSLGSGLFVDYTLQSTANTATAFYLLGRLAISNGHTTTYLYIPELFPTTLRSSGLGLCLTGGCLGGMLAPYLLPLHDLLRWAPGTSLIGVLTVCIFLLLRLPETKGKQLVSTIQGGQSCGA